MKEEGEEKEEKKEEEVEKREENREEEVEEEENEKEEGIHARGCPTYSSPKVTKWVPSETLQTHNERSKAKSYDKCHSNVVKEVECKSLLWQ